MNSSRSVSRIVGVLILAQMLGSGLANFALAPSLSGGPVSPADVAAYSRQTGVAVFVGLATGAAFVGLAIAIFSVIRRQSEGMALWLVALAVVGLSVSAVEQIGVMSLVSLNRADVTDRSQLDALRVVVEAARNWSHFLGRFTDGAILLVFYAAIYRWRLVPRALAGFGFLAGTLQLIALGAVFFGQRVVFIMLAPMGLSQLVLALWLIVKGFSGPDELFM